MRDRDLAYVRQSVIAASGTIESPAPAATGRRSTGCPRPPIGTRSDKCSAAAACRPRRRSGFPDGRRISRVARKRGEEPARHTEIEVGRQQADERFVAQCSTTSRGIGDGFGHDREREARARRLPRRAAPRAFGQPRRHARPRAISATSGGATTGSPSRRRRASRGRSGALATWRGRDAASSSLRIACAAPAPSHAELRGRTPPPIPHDELHAEVGFELADVLRDVRLHRVQAVGRGRERTFFGDGEQRFELADVDAALPGPNCVRRSGHIGMADLCYRLHAFDR